MPKKKLGTKCVCASCGCYFYDMRKSKPICPQCGAAVSASSATGRRPVLAAEEVAVEEEQNFDALDADDVDTPPANPDEVTSGGLKDIAVDSEGQVVGALGAESDDEESEEGLDLAEDEDEKSAEEGDEDAEEEDEI